MELTERVAYLKGLVEGLGITDESKEGKVIAAMVEILDDMALSISDLEDGMEMMSEQLEGIDDDLEDLIGDLYDDEDDDHGHCGCGCEDEDYEGELYEVTCPSCSDVICIDEDMLDEGEIDCPGCGERLEFDFSGSIADECGAGDSDEKKK